MEIQSVGIGSISYTEDSQDLINLRNQGAMMSDPSIREGYVQKNIAEGLKAAGSNKNGSMSGFMGMGLGMQTGGNFMAAASQSNMKPGFVLVEIQILENSVLNVEKKDQINLHGFVNVEL